LISVTADVQAWASGETNCGWVIKAWDNETDGTGFSACEADVVDRRPCLRIQWVPAGTQSVSFRQGVNDYNSEFDTRLRANAPDENASAIATLFSDWAVSGDSDNEQILMRFDNIIGSSDSQIPAGALVGAAVLDLNSLVGNGPGAGGKFHALLKPWEDTSSTWNSWVDGISADGVEAAVDYTAAMGNAARSVTVQATINTIDLTPDVQAWVSGTRTNYGWVILPWPNGTDGWGFGSAEQADPNFRPQLRVYFTTNYVAESVSIAKAALTGWSASNVQIQFSATANKTYSILRASALGGTWTPIGTATSGADGKGSYTDAAPPAGGAFYRVSYP